MAELMHLIEQNRFRFSKGQKKIANYITSYYDQAAFMTAIKLGEAVGVSESTVVRFAYSLGFDGYPALQNSMKNMVKTRLTMAQRIQMTSTLEEFEIPENIMNNDLSNIRETIDSFDMEAFNTAVSSISSAERVYILGERNSMPLARFLSQYLGFILENAILVDCAQDSALEHLLDICYRDTCVAFGFPRYNAGLLEAMRFAKSHNARMISLTDSASSPIAALSECVLVARTDNLYSFVDSFAAPMTIVNALISAVGNRNRETATDRLQKLEQLWKSSGIFVSEGNAE